jgi:hypothetical protein
MHPPRLAAALLHRLAELQQHLRRRAQHKAVRNQPAKQAAWGT